MPTTEAIKARYEILSPLLDERSRRLLAGAEAKIIGRGGIAAVSKATGTSRNTVRQGVLEVEHPNDGPGDERVGRPGGGRKPVTQSDPGLEEALDDLIEPATRGDPMSPLRWVSKSTRHLAKELTSRGHPTNQQRVAELLHRKGFSLQANRKTEEGGDHPDRNAQFEYISEQVKKFQQSQQPVISVDAKKRELVGNFKNGGREWLPEGQPEEVNVYDFIDDDLGRATPYGVLDIAHNEGWVSVGKDHNTAAFAVSTIQTWWKEMGRKRFPEAKSLLITADGGGSNGSRNRLWKRELQRLATEFGLSITVCHLPPGTKQVRSES
jgi:hypothetical protein